MAMTVEQQRALALARARRRRAEAVPESTATETAMQPFAGFNEGLAYMAKLPGRAIEEAAFGTANALREWTGKEPLPDSARKPGPGVETIEDIEQYFNKGVPESRTKIEKRLRAGGRFAGENVVPGAAVLGTAGRGSKIAVDATAPLAERLYAYFGNAMRAAPGRAAGGEVMASFGAGFGGETARQMNPDSHGAQIAGEMIGAMAPSAVAVAPANLIRRGVKSAINRTRGANDPEKARAVVQSDIGELTPDMKGNLQNAEALREEIPGLDPSLAEATRSKALARTQQNIENKAFGRELEAYEGRRTSNVKAVQEYADLNAPGVKRTPEYIIDTASGRVNKMTGKIDGETGRNVEYQKQIADRLQPTNKAQLGEGVRDSLDAARQSTKDNMNKLADELGINDADLTFQFGNIRKQIKEEFAPQSVFEDTKNRPDILAAFDDKKLTKVTFQDLKTLRERLTDDIIDTMASPQGRTKKLRTLVALKQRVSNTMDGLLENADPKLRDNYAKFRQAYKDQYIDRFEKGVAFKVRQKDGRAFYKIDDEKVADEFFKAGGITSARQYKAIFGESQNAAMEAAVMDSLRNATVDGDIINSRKFQTWMKNHKSVLDEFPGIKAKVENTDAINTSLLERNRQLAGREKRIQQAALSRQISAYDKAGKQPIQIIRDAASNPKLMASLIRSVKTNPDALNGMKRQVWQDVVDLDAPRLSKYMLDNEKPLAMLLGKQHMENLKVIQAAKEINEFMPSVTGSPIDPNPLQKVQEATGMNPMQMASRYVNVKSGRLSARVAGVDAFGRFIRGYSQKQRESLFREALYDPKVATDIAEFVRNPTDKQKMAKRINTWLFQMGQEQEDENEDNFAQPDQLSPQSALPESTGENLAQSSDDDSSLDNFTRENEGLRFTAYDDTTGNRTVGVGFNMDSGIAKRVWKQAGVESSFDDVYKGNADITDAEAAALEAASGQIAARDAVEFLPEITRLSPARQKAVLDLSYQLGLPSLQKFTKFKSAMKERNFKLAARELANSEYFKQTPQRARRVIEMIVRG